MKKTLTRAMSLILVLIMVLGVLPMAAAAGSPTISVRTSDLTLGEDGTIAVKVQMDPHPDEGDEWSTVSWSAPGAQITASAGSNGQIQFDRTPTLTYSSAGRKNVSCTVTYRSGETRTANASFEIKEPVTTVAVTGVTLNHTSLSLTAGGDTATLSASVAPSDATNKEVRWSSNSTSVATVSNGVVTPHAEGTAVITATTVDGDFEDTCTVHVAAPVLTGISITGGNKVNINESLTLTAVAAPNGAAMGALSWEVTSGTGSAAKTAASGNTCTIKGTAVGTVTVKVTDTVNNVESSLVVTVGEPAYQVAFGVNSLTVKQGETIDVPAIQVKDSAGKAVSSSNYTYTWAVLNTDYATVSGSGSSGKITGVAVGTTSLEVAVTVTGTDPVYKTVPLEVVAGVIECANYSAQTGTSNAYALNPKLGTSSSSSTTAYWTYEKVRGSASLNTSTGVVSSTGAAWAEIKISAFSDSAKTKKIGEKVVYVSFYNYNNISVEMPEGATALEFDKSSDLVGSTANLRTLMMKNYVGPNETTTSSPDRVSFIPTDKAGTVGKLTGLASGSSDYTTVAGLGDVKFQVTGGAGGKYVFVYTVTMAGANDVKLLNGQVTIEFDGSLDAIKYSTTYNKSVTFKESDFAAYWKAADMDSDLSYVTFTVDSTVPKYGELYNSTSKTDDAYEVKYSQKYFYGSYSSSSGYDLGAVTYVPNKNKTETYNVEIGFTAYGKDSKEKIGGTVIIALNEKGNNITSRGTKFGSKYNAEDTYVDQIAAAYKTETDKILGYVIFDLPDPEKATLFERIPSSSKVAEAVQLKKDTKLWVSSSSTYELEDVALIPAAGYKGKITLNYTAYDANGEYSKKMSIAFDVTSKSASEVFTDVNAKNYSWASDSVDFLYYEGTAQGSNGKYNPAASITRRDFMLMLYRAFLEKDYGSVNVVDNFPDVPVGTDSYSREIYKAVGVAKYLGIAQGTNERFNPTANITRQEAMVLIYRTLETINKDLRYSTSVRATSFRDYNKIGTWATTAINNLVSHGVILGTDEKINPQNNITRAEMAVILHRVITY